MGKKRMIGMATAMIVMLIAILVIVYMMVAGRNKKTSDVENETTTEQQIATTAVPTKTTITATENTATQVPATSGFVVQSICDELLMDMGLDKTSPLDAHKICYFYGIDQEKIADAYGYISDVALADEIVIMQAADGVDVGELETAANNRLTKQKDSFKDYIPEEAKRLEDAQIVTQGNYVMYLVSDNKDAIVSKFKEKCQ